MNSFQKIFFTGIIVVAAIIGSRLGSAGSLGGDSANAIPEFSAAGSAALLGTAAGIAESSSSRSSRDAAQVEETSTPPAFYRFGTESPPSIQAHAAFVADLETGTPYLELNADSRWPMASITKLMTAALAARSMDQNKILTFGPADFPPGDGGAADFFKPGLSYSVADAMKAMLLLSKNEAAEALANAYGRSLFVDGLNNLASEWGLASTYFADPTGLSVANQSTARDIAAMASHAYRDFPKIFAVTRAKKASVAETSSGKNYIISNINEFAGRPDFLGGKTGHTDEAGENLISIFSYPSPLNKGEGRPVVVVVLGAGDRFGETDRLLRWFEKNFRVSR